MMGDCYYGYVIGIVEYLGDVDYICVIFVGIGNGLRFYLY